MLLRRVIEHVRAQNWTAVALDFVIVVVGVFIGIQFSNLNAERTERVTERDTLIRLHADILESIAGQTRDLDFLRQQLADQEVVIAALTSCVIEPEDDLTFQRGISSLAYINPPRLYRRTVDEIAASGRTDILTNPEIAAELARIVALVEWRAAGHAQIISTAEHYRRSLEVRVRHDLSRIIDDPYIPNHRSGIEYDIGELCKDATLANGVSAISYLTMERLEAYEPILAGFNVLLPRIADELNARWGVDLTESAQ